MKPKPPKYAVRWHNPETKRWEVYQENLSMARAQKLSSDLRYTFGVRWFGQNVATEVVGMSDPHLRSPYNKGSGS